MNKEQILAAIAELTSRLSSASASQTDALEAQIAALQERLED